MADGLNRVTLFGNLTADPELRMTQGGQAVLKMRIACSESYLDRNKQRQERTEFMNVVLWGKRAEALSKFLTKGSKLLVEGSLRTTSYDDKDGNKRYKTEINANNVVLAGSAKGGGSRHDNAPADDDDTGTPPEQGYTSHPVGGDDDPDSIPF